ncbi:MAG TPA: phosphate regulon sensor histidine kinase PhoR [Burkholderiaceae bacterium]|nr:phosphate regulon sensor histidine kinase PhoR [Burkholderiaceae bacterium]
MVWLLPRVLAALAAAALGALVAYWLVGLAGPSPAVESQRPSWALAGALIGVAIAVALDLLRARPLLNWLRGTQDAEAPRHTGFWGELGYRIERALRSREHDLQHERQRIAQFLSAIEASPNGVVLIDGNEQIEWCNSTAADHLGIDPVRDLRQRVTNLVRAPAFVAHLQAGAPDQAVTFSLPGRAGVLSVWVRPYVDGQKLLLTQDITERLRTDEMRRDFVANASHEIRTPLTVLAGFVDTMNQIELTPPERKRVLSLMKEQTDRMRVLLDDLLTLAQLEGGPRPPVDQWIDVEALLRRVQADAQSLSAGRHDLVFEVATGAVAGAESQLYGALLNLVSNAVRHTPAGGRITVSWQRRAQGAGVFEVRDSGIGIAREHLPRLGERFYRVDDGRSRSSGGTGLGLAIAKHTVQRHGGELSVDSEPGKGSAFRLVLPASRVR